MADMRPVTIDIHRVRGDTFPIRFNIADEDGVAIPITGWTFRFTVDPEAEPADATQNTFQLTIGSGLSIVDGPGGVLQVGPFEDAQVAEVVEHHYDLQAVDSSSNIRTIAKGAWNLYQDVTKNAG